MPVGKRATLQMVALVFGAIYLLAGILGFFSHALLGIFQVNLLHNLVHVGIGVGGLAAASRILLLLGLIGIGVANPFGLLFIGGADIALHLVTGGVLAYFGFVATVSTRSS
jgi:hypothetical protein